MRPGTEGQEICVPGFKVPRNKLREAQPIVKDFCRDHAIAYHETGVLRSYREILQHLHEVGAPLRQASKVQRR